MLGQDLMGRIGSMATKRTYGDSCAAAHALDLVGERWALLVVRELLLGPKRFTDLRAGLPNVSPNVLSQRLHELEESGLVSRRRLGPPVSAQVYDLTEWGSELEQVLIYLGRWGRRSPLRELDANISTDAIMLAVRAHFDPVEAGDLAAAFAVHLEGDAFVIRVSDGTLEVSRGSVLDADAMIEAGLRTFAGLATGRLSLDTLLETQAVKVDGDVAQVRRLLDALTASAASSAGGS